MPRINIGLSKVSHYASGKRYIETKNIVNILIRGNFNSVDYHRKIIDYVYKNYPGWVLVGCALTWRRRKPQ